MGRPLVNWVAADWAASSRVGVTSVASMDSDTSITSITVARLRGTRSSAVGPASDTVSRISDTSSTAAGTCFHQPWRRGATFSSSDRLVKRRVRRRRCRNTNR